MTKIINFFAGPSAGKSTMAAQTFAELKWRGVNCELVTEYAKDLVWGRNLATLENQIYVFAKQHNRIYRLLGQVEYIITDSPFLLSVFYDKTKDPNFQRLVMSEFNKLDNINFFLERRKDFNPKGRIHNLEESEAIDKAIKGLLNDYNIPFTPLVGTSLSAEPILRTLKIK
jgi:hypothetical protein